MKKSIFFLLAPVLTCAAGVLNVEVKTDKPNAVYRSGETATITAVATEDGKPVSGRTVLYDVIADGGVYKKGKFVSSAEKPFTFKHKFTYPSALRAEFTILDAEGKKVPLKKTYDQVRFAGGRIGAVADPCKILPSAPAPEDFDVFWQDQLKRLAEVQMKELEKVPFTKFPARYQKILNIWDVKISCVDNVPVSGYLAIPKNAKPKSLPAILSVQGAGVHSAGVGSVISRATPGAICLEINAHGLPNGMPKEYYNKLRNGKYKLYYTKVYPNRESHIFLNMALRVCRALEYLRALPEWDGKNLIVRGASQGGWQAIVGAALDPKVSLCIAGVPGFGDFDGEFTAAKRMKRAHFAYAIRQQKKPAAEVRKMLKTQSYFDPVNFARKIKCQTFVTVGYVDLSCPTTSVYAIYNSIPGSTQKKITAFPGGVHATSPMTDGDIELAKTLKRAKK